MAIIALPAVAQFDRLDWLPEQTVQVNQSDYDKSRRVLDLDNGGMRVSVAIQVATELEDRAWRSFHAKLRGPANTFRLPATQCKQHTITGTPIQLAADAAAGATSISTKNWANASALLKDAQYITINDQLIPLGADVPGSGTNRTLTLDVPLRQAATTNTTVYTENPTGLVWIPGGEDPQTVDGIMTWSFEAEEAR